MYAGNKTKHMLIFIDPLTIKITVFLSVEGLLEGK
jgi:hypothetical protein